MATSIAFGLMFSTILVLMAVPALLFIYERLAERISPLPVTQGAVG